ncbi:MAG: T9SS type A sorting domain-containing protein [Bacteroidota bacterium]
MKIHVQLSPLLFHTPVRIFTEAKITALLIFFLTISSSLYAQNLSGIVNDYAQVKVLSGNTLTLTNVYTSLASFDAGNKVIVMQMKGATTDVTDSPTFGAITALGNAGNYEFATILSRSDSTVSLSSLSLAYSVAGAVQLISVPQYTNATITGTITAAPWNSILGRGGVVALQVSNTLTMSANIDASGQGFMGGTPNATNDGSAHISSVYAAAASSGFAGKGEGIAWTPLNQEAARGAMANAGGGGNIHNGGGGGGSNHTQGGKGGLGWIDASVGTDYGPGLAGNSLNYSTSFNKVFMGGGGGAGQQNNGVASSGGKGGGIILVGANTLTLTGAFSISANGSNASNSYGNDGAGGGGAGGAVLLDVITYNLSAINQLAVRANGGNAGMVSDGAPHGGGGGGGTGIILHNKSAVPANANFTSTAGNLGLDCFTCASTSTSSAGEACTTCSVGNFSMYGLVSLPIELVSFSGSLVNDQVQLTWQTAQEINNEYFTVERSNDAKHFSAVLRIQGAGSSTHLINYQAVDTEPIWATTYYRLKQTASNGEVTSSKIIAIHSLKKVARWGVYPNPAQRASAITLKLVSNAAGDAGVAGYEAGEVRIAVADMFGKELYTQFYSIQEGENNLTLNLIDSLTPGVYLLSVRSTHQSEVKRLVIE